MQRLDELFEVTYGNKFDFNKMVSTKRSDVSINFVGRSSQNHGVSGVVTPLPDVAPYESGLITVALGGSKLLSSFIQEGPFYTAQNVAVLRPLCEMTFKQKLFVCMCIRHNRFRYSAFGREANRTLRSIEIPDLTEFPAWLGAENDMNPEKLRKPALEITAANLDTSNWGCFTLSELFEIERGVGPRRKDLDGTGETPFVTSTDSNNGVTGATTMKPTHKGNTIGVNRNGSIAEAFYQPIPFCSTEDVHIFTPKFELNPFIALFITTLIRREKYRFGYGRKWGIQRMKSSIIRLPVTKYGEPDWKYMEQYIKTLPYSSQIK